MNYPRQIFFDPIKRLIDIVGSIVAIIIFSPIMVACAILVRRSSPGPIIFRQQRVGKNNRNFNILKFRSMYIGDNDKFLREKHPQLWDKYIKSDWKLPMNEDPRITPVGKKMRSYTFDEFPQFFNVLKGEMSLVGPRAYRPTEIDDYLKRYPHLKKYIDIIRTAKPGITGLWQISGRNELPFEQRAKLDAQYIESRSLRQEISILLKTPLAMFSRW